MTYFAKPVHLACRPYNGPEGSHALALKADRHTDLVQLIPQIQKNIKLNLTREELAKQAVALF